MRSSETSQSCRIHKIKKQDVTIALFERPHEPSVARAGTILFIHGSSMSSRPTFDLLVPGLPDSSLMAWLAAKGFDCWCVDLEGYGLSDKWRNINCDVANGAEDIAVAVDHIVSANSESALNIYGVSSGALRAGVYAQRHPDRVRRLILDAFVWTGRESPTLQQRSRHIENYLAANRRPIDRAYLASVFTRDHPDAADERTIACFADAVLALDRTLPNGTYVDMCTKLPLVDPGRLTVPTMVMRGEHDGIAHIDDLLDFFKRLPNNDKAFTIIPDSAHLAILEKNYLKAYHAIFSFFSVPNGVSLSEQAAASTHRVGRSEASTAAA